MPYYQTIIAPDTLNEVSLHSQRGGAILAEYVKKFKKYVGNTKNTGKDEERE